MSKKKFISSVGLKSGEKNSKPQISTDRDWMDVDWFLHTWGFLPNDEEKINYLSNGDKNYLILLLLDFCWRKYDEKLSREMIIMVQDFFEKIDPKIMEYFSDDNG